MSYDNDAFDRYLHAYKSICIIVYLLEWISSRQTLSFACDVSPETGVCGPTLDLHVLLRSFLTD